MEKVIFYKKRLFWYICGAPSFLSGFYLFLWATPRYESEAIVRVYESGSSAADSAGGAGASMMGSGAGISSGSYILKDYLASWDLFRRADDKALRDQWGKGDIVSRFGGVTSLFSKNEMRLWNYYKARVTRNIDEESGLVHINVDLMLMVMIPILSII